MAAKSRNFKIMHTMVSVFSEFTVVGDKKTRTVVSEENLMKFGKIPPKRGLQRLIDLKAIVETKLPATPLCILPSPELPGGMNMGIVDPYLEPDEATAGGLTAADIEAAQATAQRAPDADSEEVVDEAELDDGNDDGEEEAAGSEDDEPQDRGIDPNRMNVIRKGGVTGATRVPPPPPRSIIGAPSGPRRVFGGRSPLGSPVGASTR